MTRAEWRWVVVCALLVMGITCLPYLYVASFAPPGTTYTGLLFAADDHSVYLAWAQQAAQGNFFIRNLFTGDPQRGIYISLLTWLVGSVARVTELPLIFVHHGMRFLSGMLLLVLAYRLFALFTPDVTTRRAAFWFTAFSAGFGWLFPWPVENLLEVVDRWQPEAITFLCLYVNGLFCVALSLMLGIFLLLLGAEGKNGWARWGRVLGAGVLGLLLGNVHSYDIITVVCLWVAYLAVRTAASLPRTAGGKKGPAAAPFALGRALADAVVAGLVATPAVAYQYYLYRVEPVFRMRADDQFLSPALIKYLMGYGLLLPLAVYGAIWMARSARSAGETLGQRLFPLVWAVVGFAIPYLPFTFQRKLVMGLHLPLAFLAAVGAVALARRFIGQREAARKGRMGRTGSRSLSSNRQSGSLPHFAPGLIVLGLLLVMVPTNWRFVHNDVTVALAKNEDLNTIETFLPEADLATMRWARRHLPKDGVIFCSTASGRLFPSMAGRPVYVGHWSETPHAHQRMTETLAFYGAADATSEERRAFLASRNVRYVYHGPVERAIGGAQFDHDPLFRPIYRNAGATLYEVQPPARLSTTPQQRDDAGRG